jgi:hypothetical protein
LISDLCGTQSLTVDENFVNGPAPRFDRCSTRPSANPGRVRWVYRHCACFASAADFNAVEVQPHGGAVVRASTVVPLPAGKCA